jgi:hypothetical protein
LAEHAHHVTRDAEADPSRRRHGVQDDGAIGVDLSDIAVSVVAVPGVLAAPTKAGHVPHDLTVGDLELIQALHLRAGVSDEVWPLDFREVTVGLVRGLESLETSRELLRPTSVAG